MMATRGGAIGKWVMGVISVAIVAGITLLAIPMVFGNHRYPQYQESEVKANLHNIQLALERYAVDYEGPYPLWISGGSYVDGTDGQIDSRYMADSLISEGYMPSYPRNPFHSGGSSRHVRELVDLQMELNDPLRPSSTHSLRPPAYRFGSDYSLMGNVLADPRFAEMTVSRDENGNPVTKRTGADVIYRCWDIEELEEPQHWLQGQFFYKSMGLAIAVGGSQLEEPDFRDFSYQASVYMLGAYGSVRTKGQDVLGEEQILRMHDSDLEIFNFTGLEIAGFDKRQASPFGMTISAGNQPETELINPNGVRDQVVLVLSAGDDMPFRELDADVQEEPEKGGNTDE